MSRVSYKNLAVAAAIGGALALTAAAPASAATPRIGAPAIFDRAIGVDNVVTVRHRGDRLHRYDRRRHGPRYRYRRDGYSHYHDGYWYRRPFFSLTIPFGGAIASSRSSHVEWCDDRYRSYDIRRDAFKGYDGRWHRCNSPYS